jgi:hypothetical protein
VFQKFDIIGIVETDAVIVEALSPKLTPLPFENVMFERFPLVVPALTLIAVRLVAIEAVSVDALNPKDTPFEFDHVQFERLALVVPALMLTAVRLVATEKDAVMTLAEFIPKLMLFALENETVPLENDETPARIANGVSGSVEIEAVIVDPLNPKETLFEFERTKFERFALVVPALTFTFVRLVATEAVIV